MIDLKVNGKVIPFPTSPADLTLGQFFAIRNAPPNPIDEFCAVTGIDRDTVSNFKSPDTLRTANALMLVLATELKKGAFGTGEIPDKIFFGGKLVKVPNDLKIEPVGAFFNIHNLLADKHNDNVKANKGEDFTDCIPKTLAHYFFKHYHLGEQYNEIQAEAPEYMKKIMSMPLTAAIPLANYFFLKFPNLE